MTAKKLKEELLKLICLYTHTGEEYCDDILNAQMPEL